MQTADPNKHADVYNNLDIVSLHSQFRTIWATVWYNVPSDIAFMQFYQSLSWLVLDSQKIHGFSTQTA